MATVEQALATGLSKQDANALGAFEEIGKIFQEVAELRKQPEKWADHLTKIAKADIDRVGYYRCHPSVGDKLDQNNEIRLTQEGTKITASLGDPYWSDSPQQALEKRKGKTIMEFPSLVAALKFFYDIP